MENFCSLPKEKQRLVRDAALRVFGQNRYRKASIKDVADAAGISKSMVFYYFGTKKELYLYLVDYCSQVLTGVLLTQDIVLPNDYFDRMYLAMDRQMKALKDEPFLLPFLRTMLSEADPEITQELHKYKEHASSFQSHYAFSEVDLSKFKDEVDPVVVLRMFVWMAEGFSRSTSFDHGSDLQKATDQFAEVLRLLKRVLYKEEFQWEKQ